MAGQAEVVLLVRNLCQKLAFVNIVSAQKTRQVKIDIIMKTGAKTEISILNPFSLHEQKMGKTEPAAL